MQAFGTGTPSGVYLLADHLDATLAVGEDLLAEALAPVADLPPEQDGAAALSGFVARLGRHEQGLLLRLLQARRRAGELAGSDGLLKAALGLFVANTAVLDELVTTFAADSETRFQTGDDPLLFLRRRGLVSEEAAAVSPFAGLDVSEDYRVGGVIALGPLLDMVAGVLDLLDSRYDLYPERETAVETAIAATVTEPAIVDPEPAGLATDPEPDAPAAAAVAEATADGERPVEGEKAAAKPAPGVTARSLAEALREIREVV